MNFNWSITNIVITLLFVLSVPYALGQLGILQRYEEWGPMGSRLKPCCAFLLLLSLVASFFGTVGLLTVFQQTSRMTSLYVTFLGADDPTILSFQLPDGTKARVKLLVITKFEPDPQNDALTYLQSRIMRGQKLTVRFPQHTNLKEDETREGYVFTGSFMGDEVGVQMIEAGFAKADLSAKHYIVTIQNLQKSCESIEKRKKRGLWRTASQSGDATFHIDQGNSRK